ncbi:hypothetical protein BB558_006413 [Smittium angustum]|uniref:Ubiquitin-like protease family profile domain-containing protein n=1 Tax=Smittium angustum TaxID=133377 RepID=A0A2U1IXV5_SMIAN|nr:hypothetical protein BB558_006413 [Smittium angustum]
MESENPQNPTNGLENERFIIPGYYTFNKNQNESQQNLKAKVLIGYSLIKWMGGISKEDVLLFLVYIKMFLLFIYKKVNINQFDPTINQNPELILPANEIKINDYSQSASEKYKYNDNIHRTMLDFKDNDTDTQIIRRNQIIEAYTGYNSRYSTFTHKKQLNTKPCTPKNHYTEKVIFGKSPSYNSLHSKVSSLNVQTQKSQIDALRNQIKDALKLEPEIGFQKTPVFDSYIRDELEKRSSIENELKTRMTISGKPNLPINIDQIIRNAFSTRMVCNLNNVTVGSRDLETLLNGRSKDELSFPKVHCFSTFFYTTLAKGGYVRVKRWTKKVNLFEKDYVILPVHLGNHWCCAVIDIKGKKIEYFDSLLGDNMTCLNILANYLSEESNSKLDTGFDVGEFRLETPKAIPRQLNGYDCGVFACTFAEYSSRKANLDFSQKDAEYLRKKMMLEIIQNKLL